MPPPVTLPVPITLNHEEETQAKVATPAGLDGMIHFASPPPSPVAVVAHCSTDYGVFSGRTSASDTLSTPPGNSAPRVGVAAQPPSLKRRYRKRKAEGPVASGQHPLDVPELPVNNVNLITGSPQEHPAGEFSGFFGRTPPRRACRQLQAEFEAEVVRGGSSEEEDREDGGGRFPRTDSDTSDQAVTRVSLPEASSAQTSPAVSKQRVVAQLSPPTRRRALSPASNTSPSFQSTGSPSFSSARTEGFSRYTSRAPSVSPPRSKRVRRFCPSVSLFGGTQRSLTLGRAEDTGLPREQEVRVYVDRDSNADNASSGSRWDSLFNAPLPPLESIAFRRSPSAVATSSSFPIVPVDVSSMDSFAMTPPAHIVPTSTVEHPPVSHDGTPAPGLLSTSTPDAPAIRATSLVLTGDKSARGAFVWTDPVGVAKPAKQRESLYPLYFSSAPKKTPLRLMR